MRIYFIFVFIILYSSIMAQGVFEGEFYNPTKNLGIGIIKVNTEEINYYKDINNKKKFSESIYTPKEVIPIFFKPDYGIFLLICLEEQQLYYKVLSANNEVFYVDKSSVIFLSWEKFLKGTTGISNLDWNTNPLHRKPTETSVNSRIRDKEAIFEVKEVKKDWIQIKNEENPAEKGWIKWRKEDKLLIELYLLM